MKNSSLWNGSMKEHLELDPIRHIKLSAPLTFRGDLLRVLAIVVAFHRFCILIVSSENALLRHASVHLFYGTLLKCFDKVSQIPCN